MKPIILIQGPIYENTFSIYQNYVKNGFEVVVSTYSSTDYEKLRNFGLENLILCDLPPTMGIYNRNGQRVTTNLGLKKIKLLHDDCFVLKTRSDHFFKNIKQVISKFLRISALYKIEVVGQNERMIVPNAGTTLTDIWGPYHIGDHWMFGNVSDVLEYYTLDNVDLTKEYQFDSAFSPEPEFCLKWLENKNIFDPFEKVLSDRFVVLDNQKLSYTIAKNCQIYDCETDWDEWNSTDDGVITNKKWKLIKKKYKL